MLSQPYIWLSLSQLMILAAAVSISLRANLSRILYLNRIFVTSSGILYLVMTSNLIQQERLPALPYLKEAGAALILLCGLLVIAVVFSRFLGGKGDIRVKLEVRGVYRHMRHPSHMGVLIFDLGCALIFLSKDGLFFFPLQIISIFFLGLIEEQNLSGILGDTYRSYLKAVKARFLPSLRRKKASTIPHEYPFKNLVFKGGGIRGVAYTGVLDTLYEFDILPKIERVAGTSAGAITACLSSFRLEKEKLFELIDTLDYQKVPQENEPIVEPKFFGRLLQNMNELTGDINSMDRLIKKYGWYSSGYFYEWIQGVVAGQCEGNGKATFADFRQRGFLDLYIVAVNASKSQAEMFSADTTPHVAVADAVRMSMSIPLFFEALQFDGKQFGSGDFYIDGGIYNNFPIKYFDQAPFIESSQWEHDQINWETLGCYLYTPDNCDSRPPDIQNIWGFLENVIYGVAVEVREQYFKRDLMDHKRTIMISDCCVMSTEFDVARGTERYEQLVNSGREATRAFLKNYRLPFDL
ncbi:MAG: patatin-like phospholipase family protein [Anaerolineaceae bacterium]|nr:patatin-like phospholipase family protein [Anaerolineaceae bacterium]